MRPSRAQGTTLTTEDDFDVELEEASHDEKGAHGKMTRDRRNEKYGYGGSKKKFKRNDDDAGDLSVFDKRGKGGRRGESPRDQESLDGYSIEDERMQQTCRVLILHSLSETSLSLF
jgi:hypothetical protein